MTLYTPKFGIPYGWGIGVDPGALQAEQLRQLIDSGIPAAFGQNPYGTSGLVYAWFGGVAVVGGVLTQVTGGTVSLAPSSTTYIERTAAGVVTSNTSGWTTGKYAMAKVVTGTTGITSIQDWRCFGAVANP